MTSDYMYAEMLEILSSEIKQKFAELAEYKDKFSPESEHLLVEKLNELEVDFSKTSDLIRDIDWDSDLTINTDYSCF